MSSRWDTYFDTTKWQAGRNATWDDLENRWDFYLPANETGSIEVKDGATWQVIYRPVTCFPTILGSLSTHRWLEDAAGAVLGESSDPDTIQFALGFGEYDIAKLKITNPFGFATHYYLIDLQFEWAVTDMDIRVCPRCRRYYIADERMFEDTDRCPHCGAMVEPREYFGDDDIPV